MHDPLAPHLSSDDLDGWLAGSLPTERQRHLDHCADCQDLTRMDLALVAQLQSLPAATPSPGFGDRVMASVIMADPFAIRSLEAMVRRIGSSRRNLAVAASFMLIVLGSMTGSIVWTLSNQDTIAALASVAAAEAGQLLWVTLRGTVSNLIEQPWYADVRSVLGNPSRLALASAAGSLVYVLALLAFRRLLILPARSVANAGL